MIILIVDDLIVDMLQLTFEFESLSLENLQGELLLIGLGILFLSEITAGFEDLNLWGGMSELLLGCSDPLPFYLLLFGPGMLQLYNLTDRNVVYVAGQFEIS